MRIGLRHQRRGTLDKILAHKRAQVARMLATVQLAPRRAPSVALAGALARPAGAPLRVLARVSPALACAAARTGVRALFLPTDGPFLRGGFDGLARARDALDAAVGEARPALVAVDFIIHPVQIDRARDAGADAVLLVAQALGPGGLAALVAAARARDLEALVDVHSDDDLAAAIAAGASIIGASGLDLVTMRRDRGAAGRLVARVVGRAVAVDLAGLRSIDDVPRQVAAAALAEPGEHGEDPTEKLVSLVAAAQRAS